MTDVKKITSLLIPMQQKPLLVPAACVVEIMDYSRPISVDSSANWYLGDILWRGETIPLISFERLNNRRFAEFSATARLAVFNRIINLTTESPKMKNTATPFYAMVVQGLPQVMKLEPQEIQTTDAEPGIAEAMRVIVHGLPSCIPNLELVEKSLQSLFKLKAHDHEPKVNEDHPKDTALV